MDIASQPLAISQDFPGVITTYARHFLQLCRVGMIKDNVFTFFDFDGKTYRISFICLIVLLGPVLLFRSVSHQGRSWQVVVGNVDVWFQLAILLDGQTVKSGKVLLLAIDTTPCTVFIDVAYLPGLQSQAEQLGGIGGVGVKGKTFCLC